MINTLNTLITAAKTQVASQEFPEEMKDYPELIDAVFHQDFADEIAKLEDMLTLKDEQAIKLRFAELCRVRNEQNQESMLHFFSSTQSDCNKLYFELAQTLYPKATFLDLFKLLIPQVTKQSSVTMQLAKTPLWKQTPEYIISLSEKPIDNLDDDNLLSELPATLDTFNRRVIVKSGVQH